MQHKVSLYEALVLDAKSVVANAHTLMLLDKLYTMHT
jgi:hypothetical protein